MTTQSPLTPWTYKQDFRAHEIVQEPMSMSYLSAPWEWMLNRSVKIVFFSLARSSIYFEHQTDTFIGTIASVRLASNGLVVVNFRDPGESQLSNTIDLDPFGEHDPTVLPYVRVWGP